MTGEKRQSRRLAAVLLLIGAGTGTAASAQTPVSFDGQYTGELTLTRVIDGDCTPPPLGSLYAMTISGGMVRFDYAPRFATTLSGRVAANGAFRAAAQTKNGVVQMTGRIRGSNVTAEIISPSCHYSFQTR